MCALGSSNADASNSDYSGAQTTLPKILLNGNNICMVSRPRLERRNADKLIAASSFPAACRKATKNEVRWQIAISSRTVVAIEMSGSHMGSTPQPLGIPT